VTLIYGEEATLLLFQIETDGEEALAILGWTSISPPFEKSPVS
jgi:hypothetical protein